MKINQKLGGKMCRVKQGSIVGAMAGAVRAGDKDILKHLTDLVNQGGEDAEVFFTHIENHPDADMIREKIPQLFPEI